jgi:hypothetical protein
MLGIGLTVGLLAVSLAVAIVCGWRGARPFDHRRGPRLVPWRMLMLLAAAAAFFMAVHLVNLLGVTTGQGRPG